jgi:hypothetical protein
MPLANIGGVEIKFHRLRWLGSGTDQRALDGMIANPKSAYHEQ